ncbi:MAG TPA: hypothetical protein V6D26_24315 [Stenomitos sp.]
MRHSTGTEMNDLENFVKQAFESFVEEVNHAVEDTGKMIQEVGEQIQILADELMKEGEVKFNEFNEWLNEQQNDSNQPRWELRQRLFTLIQGDWNLAERLLNSARMNYPGQTEDWYWEKVIYDLERDRS